MAPLRQAKLSPRVYSAVLIVVLVAPVGLALCINLARDPFQLFFADPAADVVFLGGGGKSRYQHAGVVRQFKPGAIVVGHSLAANFRPTQLERTLGWDRAYNLALNGGTIYEHRRILDFAVRHGNIEQVLWVISPVNLRLGARVSNPRTPFPEYLYDGSRLNDLGFFATLPANLAPYVAQKRALQNRLQTLRATTPGPVDPRDYAASWYLLERHRFNVPERIQAITIGASKAARAAYDDAVLAAGPTLSAADIQQLAIAPDDDFHANLRQNLQAPIAANPAIHFTIVLLPPLPLLYWQELRSTDPGAYMRYLAYMREAVSVLSPLPNVRVYAFALEPFTADLRLYKDHIHYHMAVNDYMLSSLALGRESLSALTVAQYLSAFDRQVRAYRRPAGRPADRGPAVLARGELDMEQAWQIIDAYVKGAP